MLNILLDIPADIKGPKIMYKFLAYTAVILWMILIFFLSHQPAEMSRGLSIGISEIIMPIEKVDSNSNHTIEKFNNVLRKNAHFFIYLILSILLIHSLQLSGVYGYKRIGLVLFICILYAISDEVHQYFISGRGAQVKDVFIDSAGVIVGICLYSIIGRLIRSSTKQLRE